MRIFPRPKTNMFQWKKNNDLEDVSIMKNGDYPVPCWFSGGQCL